MPNAHFPTRAQAKPETIKRAKLRKHKKDGKVKEKKAERDVRMRGWWRRRWF
jgi:hypothetical protein